MVTFKEITDNYFLKLWIKIKQRLTNGVLLARLKLNLFTIKISTV